MVIKLTYQTNISFWISWLTWHHDFWILALLTFWASKNYAVCSVHCKVVSSIPGLHLLTTCQGNPHPQAWHQKRIPLNERQMVTTYCGEYCVMYRIVKSLCCTPETNITLYFNYTSIKKMFREEREMPTNGDNRTKSKLIDALQFCSTSVLKQTYLMLYALNTFKYWLKC